MTLWIIITILLILINWFFVAAEFAIVKVRWTMIDVKIKEGNKKAYYVQDIQSKLDKYLSAMQLGITLASLWLWWVWEEVTTELILKLFHMLSLPLSTDAAHSLAVPVAFIFITILHIVVWEQLPKFMAISDPLKISLQTSWLLRWFYRLFSPFIWLLHAISKKVAKLLWVDADLEEDAHNEEELRMMLVESEEEWLIKPNSHELIQNVFSFDDRHVKDIYTPRKNMSAINITWDDKKLLSYIMREWYSRYPVYEDTFDTMIWILHTKDVMQHIIAGTFSHDTIRRIVRPYHVVPLTQTIESLLHDMQTMHSHIALVQSEFWEIIGMVTMEDIVEELIGDVQDETDTEQQPYTILEDGTWIIQWQAHIATINEILPEPIPESDAYTTLWWYLIGVRWRIPVKWEEIEDEYYTYRIENMRKHLIQWVHMQVKKEPLEK